MHANNDVCFLPSAGRQPHKWGRFPVTLPSQTVEDDFSKKVLAHARFRRHFPREISSELASHNVSCSSTYNTSTLSSRPSTAPEQVLPRYLSSSCVSHSARSYPRPGTAPEFTSIDSVPEVSEQTPSLQIVESPASFSIHTEKGKHKIPSHHWLVLEPDHELESTKSFAGRKLVGGGLIPDEGIELLHLVPDDRLHLHAAEANFKRAGRGKSNFALRHAAYAMELLRNREREAETGAMSSTLESCLATSAHLDREVSARLNRMAKMVSASAYAAKAHEQQMKNAPNSRLSQLPDLSALRRTCISENLLKGHAKLQQGVTALEEFQEFVNRRFGNTVRAWFLLDPEENMKIGEKVFVRRVLELGFRGNITAMYKYLDSDRSGVISILELDPHASMVLAIFKRFIDQHFNGDTATCFQFLDRNRVGRISRNDLIASMAKIKYEGGNSSELFDLLDRAGFGFIVPCDFTYFTNWKPRAYLFCKPDVQMMRRVKEGLIQLHGSLWRAWRLVLDTDCTMRVSWEEFFIACKKLWRYAHAKGLSIELPSTEEECAGAWRALDCDCSGWIALKEFDCHCFKALSDFKSWADQHHGGAVATLQRLDINGNARLNIWELKKSETRPSAYPGDVEALFDYLDMHNQKSVGEAEVKFLDDWDIAWEEFEDKSKKNQHRRSAKSGDNLSARSARSRKNLLPHTG